MQSPQALDPAFTQTVALRAVRSFSILWKLKPPADLNLPQGNHEEMMHETLTAPLDPDRWARNGGDTALKSYNYEVPSDHLYWVT